MAKDKQQSKEKERTRRDHDDAHAGTSNAAHKSNPLNTEFVMPGDSPPRTRSRTRSIKDSLKPWALAKDRPSDWLHSEMPDATEQSMRFAENALLTVFVTMTILTFAVAVFNYFRLSFGWTVAALAFAAFSTRARVEALRESFGADVERKRSDGHEHEAESVEWVNGFVRQIWPLIDPGLFNVLIDLLHQYLDEHAPSIVTATRVTSLDIGTNAMRMLSFRLLPHDAQVGDSRGPDHEAEFEQGLDHVNLEVDFLYSTPPPGTEKRPRNIRFLIHLNFGVKKAAFEVPVNVKVTHISGKLRLRLTLTSEPPFITHTQISFPSMPHLRITARPLKTVNVMNVPGISHYILNALRDVMKVFVAPNSWTLDVSRFLMNSEIQLAPQHQGVIVLRIGKLTLQKETNDDEELVYVSIELSTSAKPAYTTRMLPRSDEEVVFGETAFVLVPRDTLMRDESLRVSLYSKKPPQPADRCLDTVVVPLAELADAHDAYREHDSEMTDAYELHWAAAYFGVASAARPAANADSRAALYAQRIQEMLDSAVAPPADLMTGFFAVQIHNVVMDIESFSCAVFVDGQLKTRTKLINSGYVNKTVEVLCLDRHHATVTVAVLDAQDNLRGAMSMRLSTLFAYRSQATRWYNLAGAEAARIRLSTLFKPLSIHLPPPLIAPDLGTIYVHSISVRNTEQFYGHVRFRLTSSNFVAVSADTASSPAFDNDRYDTERHQTTWPMDEVIPIPVTSRQQSTLIVEMVESDSSGSPKYTTCYHLSSLGETDQQVSITLPLHESLQKARISRTLSDFALNLMHPPHGRSPNKRSKANSPSQVSREPSPVRSNTSQLSIKLDLRFVGGPSDFFETLAEIWPCQASQDAVLGLEANRLALQIPEASKPGAPPSEAHHWGDVDAPEEKLAKSPSEQSDLTTVPVKTRKSSKPLSWMKALAGKSKKD